LYVTVLDIKEKSTEPLKDLVDIDDSKIKLIPGIEPGSLFLTKEEFHNSLYTLEARRIKGVEKMLF